MKHVAADNAMSEADKKMTIDQTLFDTADPFAGIAPIPGMSPMAPQSPARDIAGLLKDFPGLTILPQPQFKSAISAAVANDIIDFEIPETIMFAQFIVSAPAYMSFSGRAQIPVPGLAGFVDGSIFLPSVIFTPFFYMWGKRQISFNCPTASTVISMIGAQRSRMIGHSSDNE